MATYMEIQEYVKQEFNFVPKSCWIAHMKELCGLPVKISANRYDVNVRQKPCPENKKSAIREAFAHFGMI